MFIVSGYKCDLLTTSIRRICNVGIPFSVSFSRSLARYSVAIHLVAQTDLKEFLLRSANKNFNKWFIV